MPLIRMETSVLMSKEEKSELIRNLSAITAAATGKPEQYVMAILSESPILLAGNDTPAAFLDVRSIGSINSQVNRKLSKEIMELLEQSLGIPGNRIYINFTDVNGVNWGFNGSTFG